MTADLNTTEWVVLEMSYRDISYIKVLAGDANGKWQLLSHVTKVASDTEHHRFTNAHGTSFACARNMYGLGPSTTDIFDTMMKHFPDSVSLMPPDSDWSSLINGEKEVSS